MEKLNNKQINKQNSKEKKNLNFKSIEENKSPIENAPMISVPKNPFAPEHPNEKEITKIKKTRKELSELVKPISVAEEISLIVLLKQ